MGAPLTSPSQLEPAELAYLARHREQLDFELLFLIEKEPGRKL